MHPKNKFIKFLQGLLLKVIYFIIIYKIGVLQGFNGTIFAYG